MTVAQLCPSDGERESQVVAPAPMTADVTMERPYKLAITHFFYLPSTGLN